MKKTLHIITILVLTLTLLGCETWQGLGRDVRGLTRWGCGDCPTQHNSAQPNQAEATQQSAPPSAE